MRAVAWRLLACAVLGAVLMTGVAGIGVYRQNVAWSPVTLGRYYDWGAFTGGEFMLWRKWAGTWIAPADWWEPPRLVPEEFRSLPRTATSFVAIECGSPLFWASGCVYRERSSGHLPMGGRVAYERVVPLTVRPVAAGLCLLFWTGLMALGLIVIRATKLLTRRLSGNCAECGYHVVELARCPECGSEQPMRDPGQSLSHQPRVSD